MAEAVHGGKDPNVPEKKSQSTGQKKEESGENRDSGDAIGTYSMDKDPVGKCIIIGKSLEANGEEVKVKGETLESWFKKQHFIVELYDNLDELKRISQEDHSNFDTFFCFILNHEEKEPGKKDGYDEILIMFGETACPTLKGKPKVFFIDCNYIFKNDPMFTRALVCRDMAIISSLQDGMRSLSDDFSSRYMKAVLTSLMELEDFSEICIRIRDLMAEETYNIVNKRGEIYHMVPAGNGAHTMNFMGLIFTF